MTILLIIIAFSIGYVIGALMVSARRRDHEATINLLLRNQTALQRNLRRCESVLRDVEGKGLAKWRMN